MSLQIRQAQMDNVDDVSGALMEVAAWLEQSGMTLWRDNELLPEKIREEVEAGLFYVAELQGEIAGVIRFQLEDETVWPGSHADNAAYIHRLAVRRKFAGGQVSIGLLNWAVERTRLLGRQYLRLDTEAGRPRVRAIYENFGFQLHSEIQIGPYYVAKYQYPVNVSSSS